MLGGTSVPERPPKTSWLMGQPCSVYQAPRRATYCQYRIESAMDTLLWCEVGRLMPPHGTSEYPPAQATSITNRESAAPDRITRGRSTAARIRRQPATP